jgi:Tol biopolymer transport system component
MHHPLRLLVLTALLLTAVHAAPAPQITAQGEKLLAAAQHQATVDGDLKGAIEEYRKIVAGARDNRALAARALVEMADSYQKLGDAEAGRIYAQIVREYADQAEAVSVARTRLARIQSSSGAAGIVTRQVWTGPHLDFTGTISTDGRYLSFRTSSGLALHDLSTGTDRPVADNPDADPWAYAMQSAISADGRQVAFSRRTKDGATRELRVVSVAGNAPAPSRLLHNDPNTSEIRPHAWSPDGRWIAVQRRTTDDLAQIGLVNAETGALRVLKSWRGRLSNRLSCSPDGRHLAFDLPADARTPSRDVFVLALDTTRETPVVVHAANDTVVGWTPDGSRLLFASNRSGANGLWALPWRGGSPSGEPALVMANVNLGEPLGITRAGALYYGVTTNLSDVFLVSINPESGVILSPPSRAIAQIVGGHTSPDWSADGRLLSYFVSGRGIAIRAMDTGETHELRPALTRMSNPRLSPDGRSLAVIATDPANGRRGIFRVDARSGEATRLIESSSDVFPFMLSWMPDGRSLVYRNTATSTSTASFVQLDLAARAERTVLEAPIVSMSLSSDGSRLAYVTDKPSWQLMVVPTAGGDPRPVALTGVPTPFMVMTWTPDDRHLLVQAASADSSPGAESTDLWLVPRDGGQPRRLALKLRFGGATQARFHPRTGQLAITAIESTREVWVMENIIR